MSQNDFSLANADGATFRADANAALQALASQSSGTAAPSTTYANQVWVDTGTGGTFIKQRNPGNSAWLTLGSVGTGGVVWYASGSPQLEPAILQKLTLEYTTNSDFASTFPIDDTIPQISEGAAVTSGTLTPTISGSTWRARFNGYGAITGTNNAIVAALFIGTGTNAVAVGISSSPVTGAVFPVTFEKIGTFSGTAAHAFALRAGVSAGTARWNGNNSGRFFGGLSTVTLTIEELR